MLVDRQALSIHLRRIFCGGLITDAVLTRRFSSNAAETNRAVLVLAGDLAKVDPLSAEVGITNLELLIQVLDSTKDDQVNLNVDGTKVIITAHDREFRLATAATRVIGSRIDDALIEKVKGLVPKDATWNTLEHQFVEGVIKAAKIMKAEVFTLSVGPKGSVLGVGDERLDIVNFDLPSFTSVEGYTLPLSRKLLVPVLEQLTDFTKAEMVLTGPDSIIGVREGEYMYIISPDKADEKR